MENKMLKELCQKYNEEEKVMEILVNISLQEGLSTKEINRMIETFYTR